MAALIPRIVCKQHSRKLGFRFWGLRFGCVGGGGGCEAVDAQDTSGSHASMTAPLDLGCNWMEALVKGRHAPLT